MLSHQKPTHWAGTQVPYSSTSTLEADEMIRIGGLLYTEIAVPKVRKAEKNHEGGLLLLMAGRPGCLQLCASALQGRAEGSLQEVRCQRRDCKLAMGLPFLG